MRRFFVFSAIFLIFASCKTNKDENSSQKSAETTFVQVERGDDAKIYSTIIFESVNSFFVDGAEKKDGFSYDKNSGEIIYSQKGKSFKIEGKFLNPPVFVLQENICENPFIFYDGANFKKESTTIGTKNRPRFVFTKRRIWTKIRIAFCGFRRVAIFRF